MREEELTATQCLRRPQAAGMLLDHTDAVDDDIRRNLLKARG